jgi:hypothetical protein
MGLEATIRMRKEALKEHVPPPVHVARIWCKSLRITPPRSSVTSRSGQNQGNPHHMHRGSFGARRPPDNGRSAWGTASLSNDFQRRNWQSNMHPGRDLRREGSAGPMMRGMNGIMERPRIPGGRLYMDPEYGSHREHQERGGWVSRARGVSGVERPGGGGGGFLRKRPESDLRGLSGPRSIPAGRADTVSKGLKRKLTDLTFEEYLQVSGELEEAHRRLRWRNRISQPNAISEWRALCIQHKVPYQQSIHQ